MADPDGRNLSPHFILSRLGGGRLKGKMDTVHDSAGLLRGASQPMTRTRRAAPDPEWVAMYRCGVPAPKIAVMAGAAATTVRYHLQIAASQDPGLRTAHHEAVAGAKPEVSAAALRNMNEVVALYLAEGGLPSNTGATARERTLGVWLYRRRREAAAGTLSPALRDGLAVIPGWNGPTARQAQDDARWQLRLEELATLRAGGGDWPRHQKTDDAHERTLGVWLHGQRIDYRAGRLNPAKLTKLNEFLPGWRQGRGHRGGRRSNH